MKLFWYYLNKTVVNPALAFRQLADESKQLSPGWAAVLVFAGLSVLSAIGLVVIQAKPFIQPWINIPPENYYFWEIFIITPVSVFDLIIAAGLAHLLSQTFNGKGTFEATFACLAFATSLPWYLSWTIRMIGVVLTLAGVMTYSEWVDVIARPGFLSFFQNSIQLLAFFWYLFLVPVAIVAAQKLNKRRAILVGFLTCLIYGFFMLIFIR
ncbi:YIP1 family protein [candidate division KSB1 bacterium]|nr:YIP1 family protein [candidate division KSB1 bacterium]